MKKLTGLLALILSAVLLFSAVPVPAVGAAGTLNVACSDLRGLFSPFFSETSNDQDVWSMTAVSLLTSDRDGAVVLKGIGGETRSYNGTPYTYYGISDLTVTQQSDGRVFYDFKLRNDVTFSDGKKLTADDVIFTMYVLSDPTLDGTSVFSSLPIEGMEAYRSGWNTLLNLIYYAGRQNTDFTYFTRAQQTAFWQKYDAAALALANEIIEYCIDEGYAVNAAGAASAWGFEGATTAYELAAMLQDAYGPDVSEMIRTEAAGSSVEDLFPGLSEYSGVGIKTGASAANISGIKKLDDHTVRVILTKIDAAALYLLNITVVPMHYYGDATKYDYAKNKFGFNKGNLGTVRAKTAAPMGAGPYKFLGYRNGVVSFEANSFYYKGAPKIKYINFIEGVDRVNGVITGEVDISDPAFTAETERAVKAANGLPEDSAGLSGDTIYVKTVNYLGYGYIGISADAVNVGGNSGSAASKNLRKAFATVFSVYRDVGIASYYGERANVINYPISDTSWAAPRPADPGYKTAFSTDVNGKDIFTSAMDQNTRYAAALQAALGYFQAAGYTVRNGKVTAAPRGASLSYEIWVPGDGVGDQPCYMIAVLASEALSKIGIDLFVRDLTYSGDLWDGLYDGRVPMWCAAWGAAVDPDMYQIYFSGNEQYEPGGSNYMYDIDDPQLNRLILEARATVDQNRRKTLYKQCLDIIADWAVEVPVYQRQNAVLFSTQRLKLSTVTPDITTFYGWMSEIETLELADSSGINTPVAVERGGTLYAAPEITASALVSAAGSGSKVLKTDGKTLGANELVGSGMTLVKPNGSKETIVIKGDTDGDGRVTANDARFALRTAVKLERPNAWQTQASHVTNSAAISAADARAILRVSVKLDKLPLV